MDRTQKLDLIEKLVSYSGLEQRRAQDFLEKANWNVDSAYRMYKNNQLDQQGFRKGTQNVTNRFSEPIVPMSRPTVHTHGVTGLKPVVEYPAGYGAVMMGTGPAVGSNYHPAFLPPQTVPKFPVELPRERIIPIEIESRRVGHVPVSSVPPPTSKKPVVPSKPDTGNAQARGITHMSPVKGDHFPKPQSYSVPIRSEGIPCQQVQDDNSSLIRIGPAKGDKYPPPKGDNSSQHTVVQGTRQSQEENHTQPTSTPKLLKRGISKISQNAMLVDEERKNVLHDIVEDCHDNMYVQTFVLPDVTGYSEDFRAFLEKDLIETSTLVSLEQAGRLNWWAELGVCQRLLPMATSGDGNCLLHAASLAMWGIHDRQLMLRKALYDTLTKKYYRQALYRRWRWEQTQGNKQAGLIFSEEEWQTEWDNVLRLASTTPRSLPGTLQRNSCCDSILTQSSMSSSENLNSSSPVVYESLEEFHVFVLAHVIQRPIIVVADTILRDASGEALAPIPFGGIYLPLECDASQCYRSPLLLTYDAAHFSALVPMEKNTEEDKNGLPVAIPVVSPDLKLLPLHFSIDPGIHFNWEKNNAEFSMPEESKLNLMKRYMDLEKLPICGSYLESGSDDKNSTGSYESDDGLIDRSKKKDNKVSQQLQSVSKQFGSFGKSVGKKLKNLGKGNKEEKKGRKVSMTQSTKVPLTITALSELEQQFIWCCKIVQKKSETHQKMIDNYLYDAGERFKKDVASRRLRNNEIVSRVHSSNLEGQQRVPCVTSGCNLYGTVETSYLCSKCFADQKQQLIDQEKDMYKTYANKGKHNMDNKEETKVGLKSKFYDMNDGIVSTANVTSQPKLVVDLSSQRSSRSPVPGQTNLRDRTPSPDYDNVDYVSVPSQSITQQGKSMHHSPKASSKMFELRGGTAQKCRNPDCSFYGSKDKEWFCSGCYKNRHKMVDTKRI